MSLLNLPKISKYNTLNDVQIISNNPTHPEILLLNIPTNKYIPDFKSRVQNFILKGQKSWIFLKYIAPWNVSTPVPIETSSPLHCFQSLIQFGLERQVKLNLLRLTPNAPIQTLLRQLSGSHYLWYLVNLYTVQLN